ncbi:MAG: hypothetical protein JWR07_2057 [Nevskia sp.]|nr:hypothetical protein [Nevskia sp.]
MNKDSFPSLAMAWHIFRKDRRLLWPLAVAGAGGQVLVSWINHRSPPYVDQHGFMALAILLTLGIAVSISLLIVLMVQQDTIPGASQDWLVRPIRRGDLLLAKLLGVLLLVHAPFVVINTVRGLSYGLPLGQSLGAALHSTLELALVYSLPLMCVAALTRSVTEAVLSAVGLALGVTFARMAVLALFAASTHVLHFSHSADGTGVAWVWVLLSRILLLLVLAAVLARQYFRRDTQRSRVLFAGGLLLVALAPDLPWQPAFAIQRGLAAHPDAAQALVLAFDAESGALSPAQAAAIPVDPQRLVRGAQKKKDKKPADQDTIAILLPLRLSGLPAGTVLHADRTTVRLVGADGSTVYRGNGSTVYRGNGHLFDVAAPVGGDTSARLRQGLPIPAKIFHAAADQPLRLEVDYALTLLRPRALPPLAALDGDRILPEAGHCATRIDDSGNAVEVNCIAVGQIPSCMSMVLEFKDGTHNPEEFSCALNYQPAGLRVSVDPLDDFTTRLPFKDASGAVRYPIDQAQLPGAQVVISVYEPQAHFSRRIVVPQFHLRDWQAAAPAASDKAGAAAPPADTDQP